VSQAEVGSAESLYFPDTGLGNIESVTGPKSENLARTCFSSGLAGRFISSMVFSVRLAAMMSRALDFSPSSAQQ
jgi:hypothetical protein